jgi:RNA polymerase sigma-70 factor (ECF subfamily)
MRSNDIANSKSVAPTNRPWRGRPDNSDEALIAKVADGNRLAMQVLYARHHSRIHRFLTRLTGDDARTEDILTEVFLSAWRHAHRFEGRMAVSTWLIAVARRKAYAALRRDGDERPTAESEAETGARPARQGKKRGTPMRDQLLQMSREHREIIDLVYYHQKSAREIADIIGISEHAVEIRMRDARARLSELLEHQVGPKA